MLRRFIPVAALTAVAIACIPGSALAQQKDLVDELSTIEKSLWDGWANNDAAPFREHLAENTVAVGPWGIDVGKQGVIEEIETHDCKIESTSFSDWAVHHVSEGVAILTYAANQDGMCGGEKMPSKLVVSSTYVRDGGKWMGAAYHETPVRDGQ